MSPSERLRVKIALVRGRLDEATDRFWSHPRLAEVYPESLAASHSVMKASVPLMETALAEARWIGARDPVCAPLADYLTRHIPEERGHDLWVLEDFEALGHSRDALLDRVPSTTAAALVGAQYYWILHEHPVALLGYIAVLEGSPPDEAALGRVIERSGLPPAAFGTLLRHARLDRKHREDLDRLVDALPLSQRHLDVLGANAIRSVDFLARLAEEAVARR